MEATTSTKAMRAIRTFLERREYEVLEEGWAHGKDKIDFIAKDEDDLVFIATKVRENTGTGLPAERADRDSFERVVAAYLAEHLESPEGSVRFDIVSMLILGDSKALIRHHVNALNVTDNDLG